MRFLATTGVLGYLGGTALAACDTSCPAYSIATCATDASNECVAPASPLRARQSHLFRRTCDTCPPADCPADSKKCTPGGQKPPQLTTKNVSFACGKQPTQYFSTSSYGNCPDDATKKCLTFQLSDSTLKQPQLEISFSPLTNSAPGQFTYNTKCSSSTCVVAIDDVLTRHGKSLNNLCTQPLYIGLHSDTAADTCWPIGDPISDKTNNWAMQYTLAFDCPVYPETCCCCAPPAPALPDKKCGSETAYASGANTGDLRTLKCTNAWGYYQNYPAGPVNALPAGSVVYTAKMLAGQTNNVGEAMVTKTSDTCFTVTLDPTAKKFGVRGAHIDVSCSDPKTNLDKFCRTPGKYKFNAGCVTASGPYTSGNVCVTAQCPNSYYFIIHADTYSIVSADAGAAYDACVSKDC